jgi:hypothetical protein
MPIVRALPEFESGHAELVLRNDSESTVQVATILVGSGVGAQRPLLPNPIALDPHQELEIDLTWALEELFNPNITSEQESVVQILLNLEPEPPTQPSPGRYRVRFHSGHLIAFESLE